ncbi:MAG TPA: hypothetical protein PKN02_11260 [Thermotogota bacterium]|nr:hypothetical protein [Thermotogota bacterium]
MTAGDTYVQKADPDLRRVTGIIDDDTPFFTNERLSPLAVIWVLTQ